MDHILVPQVMKRPGQKRVDLSNKLSSSHKVSDFKKLLTGAGGQHGDKAVILKPHLAGRPHGIKISQHAAKRFSERKMDVGPEEFMKIRDGVDKLKTKGGQDSLIVTNLGAYIVDVDNETIVTAIDRRDMAKNVFTKIDSTIFIN